MASLAGDATVVACETSDRIRSRHVWAAAERAFDLAVLLFLAPAILVISAAIALAIYLDSSGAVLYRSRRIGRDGRPFDMLKFRKMRRDAGGGNLTLAEDERFTPIGRFLTATRLDELPQVVNVLRGEMRLVGPRPELECFVADFAQHYREILTVTPGMTGIAQLRFLGERSVLISRDAAAIYRERLLPEKVRIDLAYTRTRSLGGDLLILLRTCLLPVTLAWQAIRGHHHALRGWTTAVALAIPMVLALALSSGNVT